jgi:hypothetical protein
MRTAILYSCRCCRCRVSSVAVARVSTRPHWLSRLIFFHIYLCWPTSVNSFPPCPSHIILITYYTLFLYTHTHTHIHTHTLINIYIYTIIIYTEMSALSTRITNWIFIFFKRSSCTLIWSSNSFWSSFCFVFIQYLKIIIIQLADGLWI